MTGRQTTLAGRVTIAGKGVHSGVPVTIELSPAKANSGIRFTRRDMGDDAGERPVSVQARSASVVRTDFRTGLGIGGESYVETIEHLMATFSGLGIDNVLVALDAAEAPIMDGSAKPFVDAIDSVGIVELDAPRRYIRVKKPVRIANGKGGYAEFRPFGRGFRLDVAIDFTHEAIGQQSIRVDMTAAKFRSKLAGARTFGFAEQAAALKAAGFALGASLDNTVVVGESGVMNPDGLRYRDEFVRHKALDAVGDLALVGAPIVGEFRSYRGGHKLNIDAVEALLADRSAWEWVVADAPEMAVPAGAPGLAAAYRAEMR